MKTPTYLRYLVLPARGAPLFLVVIFSLGLAFAKHAGLLGLPLAVILLSWFFKYAFVLLDTVSRGYDDPPVLCVEMINPLDEQRPMGQLLIIGVVYGATELLARSVSEELALLLRLLALPLLPASIAVLGSTCRLIDAINPVLLVRFIQRLGVDYFGLVGVIVAFAAMAYALPALELSLPLHLAILQFAWLAVFSLMGGTLYERRHELGIDVWRSPERKADAQRKERDHEYDREADEIYSHHRCGAHAAAWRTLQSVLERHGHSFEEYRAMYARIARWPDDPRLVNRLAQEWMQRQLAANRPGEALQLARDRLRADPGFRPASGAETLHLAHVARSGGDPATARRLLADFEKHFPGDASGTLAAQLASELQR